MTLPLDSEAPTALLARFDNDWTKTAVSDEMYGDIPDGIYDAVIEEARVTETMSTKRPVVIWKLRIQGSAVDNRLVTKNRVITENTLSYLREDLEKCQLSVPRLSDLAARLQELGGRPVSIEKEHEGRTI